MKNISTVLVQRNWFEQSLNLQIPEKLALYWELILFEVLRELELCNKITDLVACERLLRVL